jgi:hypothetical protein
VFAHLDEEKECDAGTWVLDTGVMNHISGCQVTFTKINMAVLGTVHFGDFSVARIEGRGTIVFMCKNGQVSVLLWGLLHPLSDDQYCECRPT